MDRILTSHVGSLVRPATLRAIMAARAQGASHDEAQLGDALKAAVADVVAKQAETGIDNVNDGEYGKQGWNRYVVEHPELVALRLTNFAKTVGRDNIVAGTDCGFSQSHDHMRVHSSIQWAKLQSLVEGARLASAQLWRR